MEVLKWKSWTAVAGPEDQASDKKASTKKDPLGILFDSSRPLVPCTPWDPIGRSP